jgi:uncharacterized protein (DUF1810 family)
MTPPTLSARHPDLSGASPLARFTEAQDRPDSGFDAALREIRSGTKTGHWIWYVFPQLAGLGSSSVSRTYGIHGLDEAREYLRNPTLRSRLLAITTEVANHLSQGASIDTLMGSSTDALKLVSSLTLFGHAARELHGAEELPDYGALARVASSVLQAAELQGYGPCEYTLNHLGANRGQ